MKGIPGEVHEGFKRRSREVESLKNSYSTRSDSSQSADCQLLVVRLIGQSATDRRLRRTSKIAVLSDQLHGFFSKFLRELPLGIPFI